MSKAAVVYWSGTGNSEAMANGTPDGETVESCRGLGRTLA